MLTTITHTTRPPCATPIVLPHEKTILIVDDDELIREMLSLVIREEYGAHVSFISVTSGEEALTLLLREGGWRPDLVLLDFLLGGALSGLEVLTKIRASECERTRRLPVILLPASREERPGIREAQRLADLTLYKPFELDDLISSMNTYLARDWRRGREEGVAR